MERKLKKFNKSLIKSIIYFFYLLELNVCFIQKVNKGKTKYNNSILLGKGFFSKTNKQSKIFGNINDLNYYYINLYLGKEKKKQSLLLDTGSGVTSIPCKPYCNQCGQHINSYLYINNNQIIGCNNEKCNSVESTCNEEENHCEFSVHYSENSLIKGLYFNEIIYFSNEGNNNNKINNNLIPIGCTIYEDNFFYTQKADGIMGLSNSDSNFIKLLYKYGVIKNNIFSLCFGKKGGYFSVDEIETKYHNEKVKYIYIDNNKYFYTLNINNIKINNFTISNQNYSSIIDSGLTITKIPIKIVDTIIDYINGICELNQNNKLCGEHFIHKELGSCYKFNSFEELNFTVYNIWPNITFSINDYDYIWKPSQYLFEFIDNKKIIGCFGFMKNRANIINLGASWMIGHDIIFDNKNNRIGIAEADCNQRDFSNDGEEINEFPPHNDDKINIFNTKGKKEFIFFIIIIIFFAIIVILFLFCVIKLKKGNNSWFILSREKKIMKDELIYKAFDNSNSATKHDINVNNDKISAFIEMNNNISKNQ